MISQQIGDKIEQLQSELNALRTDDRHIKAADD